MRGLFDHAADASKQSKIGETEMHWPRFTNVPTPKICQKLPQLGISMASTIVFSTCQKRGRTQWDGGLHQKLGRGASMHHFEAKQCHNYGIKLCLTIHISNIFKSVNFLPGDQTLNVCHKLWLGVSGAFLSGWHTTFTLMAKLEKFLPLPLVNPSSVSYFRK